MTNFTDSDWKKAVKMAEVTSLAQLMKANARLKKHVEVAKKAVGNRDFAGEPGEYITKFKGPSIIVKDGKTYYILEFNVDGTVAGQEKHNGARIGVFHSLNDSDRSTIEQALDRLMVDIQCLGVPTADMTTEQIDAELKKLIGEQFKIRVAPNKKKDGFYFNIVGHVDSDEDYSSSETDEAEQEEVADDVPVDEDEWSEELAEDEDVPVEDDAEATFNPSDWINFEVDYKPSKAPKPLTFKVVDADDDAGTVTLERAGKAIKNVKFDDLILPEA